MRVAENLLVETVLVGDFLWLEQIVCTSKKVHFKFLTTQSNGSLTCKFDG